MKKIKILTLILISAAILSSCKSANTVKNKNNTTANVSPASNISAGVSQSQSASNDNTKSTNNNSTNTKSTPADNSSNTAKSSSNFTVLKDTEIPDSVASDVKTLMSKRGYYFRKVNDAYYFAVFLGEKPTGGYKVSIASLEYNNGKAIVSVEEDKPGSSDKVTQSKTYPYVVVKLSNAETNYDVKTTSGESLNQLHVLR